jgi:N-acetylmuramate 1-kinase
MFAPVPPMTLPATTAAAAPTGNATTPSLSLDMGVLEELIAKHMQSAAAKVEPMPGGASTRKYFRVQTSAGAHAVAMFVPEGPTAEEIDNGGKTARWPFLEVRELLAERGIDVPKVIAEDTARGWLVLEDLGERTLAEVLLKTPAQKQALYTQAVADLARAQLALAELPAASIVRKRAFDFTLLHWEIQHFAEWGLDARGIRMQPEHKSAFDTVAARLAQRIADYPRRFVHRDYQSRNLMVREGALAPLVWIDFQDALMGPRVYDLVALLNDSYQQFDRAFVETRLAEFAEVQGLPAADAAALVREFDLCTVQRKLKDAGRFVFIDKVKGNPNFLKFVTPTIRKVRASLQRLQDDPDMCKLHTVLAATLGEEYTG